MDLIGLTNVFTEDVTSLSQITSRFKAFSIRNIDKALPPIQRLLLRLHCYDKDLTFTPGHDIPVLDTLSRAHLPNSDIEDKSLEYQVHLLINNLPVSQPKLKEIQDATSKDPILQQLQRFILDGFPNSKKSMPPELMPYFQFHSELSIAKGIVFKGDKIVIPSSLQKEMKERIHQGHLGIEKCKARARQVIYWPNINADISDMVSNCSICIEHQRHHQREPLISHDVPTQPRYKVGMDLFSFKGRSYLVIVDYFSNFPELCHLSDTHGTSVIAKVKLRFQDMESQSMWCPITDHNSQVLSSHSLLRIGTSFMTRPAQNTLNQIEWLKTQ